MFMLLWLVLQASSACAETMLTPGELKAGIEAKKFSVLLDVRTAQEFQSGHIEGATLAESLAMFRANDSTGGASPKDFAGCEYCDIAVYCRSGKRAKRAIQVLYDHGFAGRLFNGMGTAQWTNAGYDLVNTASIDPHCLDNDKGGKQIPKCYPSSANTSAVIVATPSESPSVVYFRRWTRIAVNLFTVALLFVFARKVFRKSKQNKRMWEVGSGSLRGRCRR